MISIRRLAWAGATHRPGPLLLVSAGVAVSIGVITGALLVGDALSAMLLRQARERLGGVTLALDARERALHAGLAAELARDIAAPVAV